MGQTRKEFENEPVVFIGINSGNPKAQVQSYLTSVKSEWPVYVDTDRSFEKHFGFEISLQNIFQARIVDGSGKMEQANPRDLAGSVKGKLSTAKWKIEPAEIPEPLKKAWRALEFGQFTVAAPLIKQALSASDAKVKEAAKKLETVVIDEIKKDLADAKAKADAGEKWEAYKLNSFVADNFKDFADAKPAQAEIAKLKSDAKVAREIQAKNMMTKVAELLASQKKAEQQQGQMGIQALIAQYADTEAGQQAKSMPAPSSK